FNGWACQPAFAGTQLSAGHWLYLPGCGITQSIGPADTTIQVENGALFRSQIGSDNSKTDEIVIVPLDGAGNRLWAQAEQVRLVSLSGNQMTVQRNIYNFAPANGTFTAGHTYIAPHAWSGPFSGNLLWLINL